MEHREHRHRRHKNNKKNAIRQTISYILAFLLSVCLTLITLLVVVKFGCFNEKSLYKNMSSYGYYDYVYDDILADVKSMTIPTGFPESIYEGVITQTHVYNDVNGSLKAQFTGSSYVTSSADIKQALRDNINKYFEENEYIATESEETAIGDYLNSVSNCYDKYIKMPLGDYLIKAEGMFNKIFLIAVIALLVVSAIIAYVILQLYKWIHRALRFFSYASFGAAAMITAAPAYLYLEKVYYRFNLSPESFYKLITTYIDNVLELFMYFGLLWLVVGIVFICATVLAKKHQKVEQD